MVGTINWIDRTKRDTPSLMAPLSFSPGAGGLSLMTCHRSVLLMAGLLALGITPGTPLVGATQQLRLRGGGQGYGDVVKGENGKDYYIIRDGLLGLVLNPANISREHQWGPIEQRGGCHWRFCGVCQVGAMYGKRFGSNRDKGMCVDMQNIECRGPPPPKQIKTAPIESSEGAEMESSSPLPPPRPRPPRPPPKTIKPALMESSSEEVASSSSS